MAKYLLLKKKNLFRCTSVRFFALIWSLATYLKSHWSCSLIFGLSFFWTLSRFFSVWFDYDLSSCGFLHVHAVQDFAELFELVILCLWQMLGSLRPLFRFFVCVWKGLKRGTLTFHLSFCIIWIIFHKKLIFLKWCF